MDDPIWSDRGVYWVRHLTDGGKLSVLVGDDDPNSLAHPCDVTLTRPDGSRFYATFCSTTMLDTILTRSEFLALNSWIAVRSMSVDEISKVVDELLSAGAVEKAFEDIGPEVEL
jgi:hypothetical protein